MGSCVSFSRSTPPESSQRAVAAAAKVVNLDGSMAQFAAGPVAITAREALRSLGGDGSGRSSPPPRFLCSSDELGFDAPARALAPHDALQPGQLYFVLPAPMLRRPRSPSKPPQHSPSRRGSSRRRHSGGRNRAGRVVKGGGRTRREWLRFSSSTAGRRINLGTTTMLAADSQRGRRNTTATERLGRRGREVVVEAALAVVPARRGLAP